MLYLSRPLALLCVTLCAQTAFARDRRGGGPPPKPPLPSTAARTVPENQNPCLQLGPELPGEGRALRKLPDGSTELTEVVPPRTPMNQPFRGWMVVPPPRGEESWYQPRSIDPVHRAVVPGGTFAARVRSGLKATRTPKATYDVGSGNTGLVVELCVDPGLGGPLRLPEPYESASTLPSLTPEQARWIRLWREELQRRHASLWDWWYGFATGGALDPGTRTRFFLEIAEFDRFPLSTPAELWAGTRFFSRDQRVALRAMGQRVEGECRIMSGQEYVVRLINCPISELLTVARGDLVATGSVHEELDLELRLKGLPADRAREIALSAIAQLPGVKLRVGR